MIPPKGFTPNPDSHVDHRIMRIEGLREQNADLLNLFHRYGEELLHLTHLEQQIATRLKVWYTDYSIYSPMIVRLREIVDHKAGIYQKEASHLAAAAEELKRIESETYKPLRATVNNYNDKTKEYEHYRRKVVKMKSSREKEASEHKVKTRNIERYQRNERKLENAMTDADNYGTKIVEETNRINLERFERFNPLVRTFIDLQLKDALKVQSQYIDIENFDQVLENFESDFYNKKYFEVMEREPVRVTDHIEEISQVRTIVHTHQAPPEEKVVIVPRERVIVEPVEIHYRESAPSKEEVHVSQIEGKSLHEVTRLKFSHPVDRDADRLETMI